MPLDRRIELRIFASLGEGRPATVANVWADRLSASIERIQEALASTSGELLWITGSGGRQDLEALIPALLIVVDDAGNEFEVSGISTDDRRRSFLTIHCSRSQESRAGG